MIHIICALKCEAGPLLQHFGLQRRSGDHLFSSFLNCDSGMSLTVTGVGRVKAAAGTLHALHSFQAREHDAWLNIGVAGHGDLPLGSVRLANRILDAATAEVWYPQILLSAPVPSCGLTTVDAPTTGYGDTMIDMEAAGYYSCACRVGTVELIHCLKLISDNKHSSPDRLGAGQIAALIEEKLCVIEDVVGQLHALSAQLTGSANMIETHTLFTERWHFTEYQRNQLKSLLQRWQVLLPGKLPLHEAPSSLKRGADVLGFLERTLDSVPVILRRAPRTGSGEPDSQ